MGALVPRFRDVTDEIISHELVVEGAEEGLDWADRKIAGRFSISRMRA